MSGRRSISGRGQIRGRGLSDVTTADLTPPPALTSTSVNRRPPFRRHDGVAIPPLSVEVPT